MNLLRRRQDGICIVSAWRNTPASQPLIKTEFSERSAAISPDGTWIAYYSDETGRGEVYVRPFPDINNGKWQISRSGGDQPRWNADGTELFFNNGTDDGDFQMLMVRVKTDPVFSVGEPEILFAGDYSGGQIPSWDISPDGQRFLMTRQALGAVQETGQASLAFVENWFEELKRLAPADSP